MNHSVALAAKAAQTTTHSVDIDNPDCSGCVLVTKMTAVGTGSVTPSISGVDPHTGEVWPILAGAAIIANGTQILKVGRGLVAAANLVAVDQLPKKLRITFTHNNANPADYVAGLNLIN